MLIGVPAFAGRPRQPDLPEFGSSVKFSKKSPKVKLSSLSGKRVLILLLANKLYGIKNAPALIEKLEKLPL